MNSEYERMRALLEDAGLSFTEHGYTNAEIYAYTAGIQLVRRALEQTEKSIIFSDGGDSPLREYARLLKLDASRYTPTELAEEIRRRMKPESGYFSAQEAEEGLNRIPSATVEYELDTLIISNVQSEDLRELGRYIEGYVPLGTEVCCEGGGMPFDKWDAAGLRFSAYDALGLPFSILDTLRSDTFEQHT